MGLLINTLIMIIYNIVNKKFAAYRLMHFILNILVKKIKMINNM